MAAEYRRIVLAIRDPSKLNASLEEQIPRFFEAYAVILGCG